eukprot:3742702-Pyramimonas_sp.AAC.3
MAAGAHEERNTMECWFLSYRMLCVPARISATSSTTGTAETPHSYTTQRGVKSARVVHFNTKHRRRSAHNCTAPT